jgi:uncharacterized membrane protein
MHKSDKPSGDIRETTRIEAFSDGVFAIAITLLILDIKVPRTPDVGLARALTEQWPSYAAFVISFATISIMWINHHRLFTLIRRSDHVLLLLNSFLLFTVTVVPFPTALVAEYIGKPDERIATLVYSGTFIVIALAFNVLWRHAAKVNGHLLGDDVDRGAVAALTKSYSFGPLLYLSAFVAAFFNVALSLFITFALAVYFALPPRTEAHV